MYLQASWTDFSSLKSMKANPSLSVRRSTSPESWIKKQIWNRTLRKRDKIVLAADPHNFDADPESLFSFRCGFRSDFSIWRGSGSRSCTTSPKWCKSATTALQSLHGYVLCLLCLYVSILSVYGPPCPILDRYSSWHYLTLILIQIQPCFFYFWCGSGFVPYRYLGFSLLRVRIRFAKWCGPIGFQIRNISKNLTFGEVKKAIPASSTI